MNETTLLTPREAQILYGDRPVTKTAPAATQTDEHLALDFEIKAFSPERREIEGYASTGHLDLVGDVILPGAFARSIAKKGPAGIAVHVNHNVEQLPVGALLEIREDDRGLFTKARIFETTAGSDLLSTTKELMALGRSMSMSIGYRVPPGGASHQREGQKLVRKIGEVDLIEVSYTTSPANPKARVVAVKQAEAPVLPTEEVIALPTDDELTALFDSVVAIDGPPIDRAKRLIRGYPVVWSWADTSETRDKLDRDTFARQVAEGLLGLPLYINHEKSAAIGQLVAFDIDDVGLFCTWRIHEDAVFARGSELLQQLHDDMAEGVFAGLSAAYKVGYHKTHADGSSRHVTAARLSEVSLLLGKPPSQPEACIGGRRKSVEQMKADLESSREFLWKLELADRDQERRDHEHRRQQFAEHQRWIDHPPAHVQKQRADEALTQARRELVEDDRRQVMAVDAAQTRRTWDWDFKRLYDRQHPGGADRCTCRPHRLWRREIEVGTA